MRFASRHCASPGYAGVSACWEARWKRENPGSHSSMLLTQKFNPASSGSRFRKSRYCWRTKYSDRHAANTAQTRNSALSAYARNGLKVADKRFAPARMNDDGGRINHLTPSSRPLTPDLSPLSSEFCSDFSLYINEGDRGRRGSIRQ